MAARAKISHLLPALSGCDFNSCDRSVSLRRSSPRCAGIVAMRTCCAMPPMTWTVGPDAEAPTELRSVYDRADMAWAPKDISSRIERRSIKDPRLAGWVEVDTHESLSFHRFPESLRKHIVATTWWNA